jgi:hypothetical protein
MVGKDGNLYFAHAKKEDSRSDYTCNVQYLATRTILPKEPISLTVTACESTASYTVFRDINTKSHRIYKTQDTPENAAAVAVHLTQTLFAKVFCSKNMRCSSPAMWFAFHC